MVTSLRLPAVYLSIWWIDFYGALCGVATNDHRWPPGTTVRASSVVGRLGAFVVTESGSVYQLGHHHPPYDEQRIPTPSRSLLAQIPELGQPVPDDLPVQLRSIFPEPAWLRERA